MNARLEEVPPPRKAAALDLAQAGFHVLPVKAADKAPDSLLAPNGFKNATRDADVIAGWFDVRPKANIGIACGPEYGLLVIDVDVRAEHDGWDSFQRIFDGTLTLTADTPQMGGHFYFRHPGTPLKAHLDGLPGIDVKGADGGGYVLAPPSALPTGAYRWKDADIPIADLPPSLLELLRADKPAKVKPAAGPVASITVPEGRRHSRLVELGAIYRGKGLQTDEIEALLWHHAQHFSPAFNPDNGEHQREIESVVRWYGAKSAPDTTAQPLEVLTTAELMARAAAAPVVQALDPILPAAGNLMIHGASGAGKSHLALAVALALATGTAVLDWQAPALLPVLFVDGEMPLNELKARLEGYLHHRPPPASLHWLAARALDGADLPDLADVAAQALYLQAIEACGARVAVFDNLSCLRHTTAESPESSAEAWHPVAAFLRRLNGHGIATVTVHHSGKAGTQRGSSHHVAVMDTVIAVKQPGAGQADPRASNDVEIVFEKHRRFAGEAAEAFRAKATEDADGYVTWSRCGVDPLAEDVARLRLQNRTIREIATTTGRSKAAIEKAIGRAQARGLLPLGAVP